MKRKHLVVCALAAAGLAGQTVEAQKPQNPSEVRKPFRMDDRPIPRAQPVERPIATPIPVSTPIPIATPIPVATPIPIERGERAKPSTGTLPPPRPMNEEAAAPAAPAAPAKPPTPEPEEPGTIRVAPSMSARSADQIQLEIADSLYAKKLFDQAAPEYQRYLELYPTGADRPVALFRLGESYRRGGVVNAAKNAYETLLGQYANGDFIGPAAYRLGELYYQDRQYREALPLFRRASVRLKEPTVVNSSKFYTARALEALGQKLDARIAYEELVGVVDNNPFQDASRLSLALLLRESGRTADALKQVQALAKQTDNPDLKLESVVRSGLWMIELGQDAKAEKELKDAIALANSSPKWKEIAQIGLLRLQYNAKKYQAVIDGYAKGEAEFTPESKPELLVLLANSYRQLEKPSEAKAIYDQILRDFANTPQAKEAQYERLKMLYYASDPSLLTELDSFLAANPTGTEHDQAVLMKAESLYKKQDFRNAVPLYAELESSRYLSGAFRGEAIFKMAFCHMQLGEIDPAVKAFTSFIDQHPTNKSIPYALIQRGLGYQQLKNYSAALKDFDELAKKYPKASERELALQQKALILGQQGDNTAMAETFKTLLKDYPETSAKAQANYWIGWTAYEAKNYKDCIAPLRIARDLDKEKFFEKASFRVLLAAFNLEDKKEIAKEIEVYANGGKEKVPTQILRWMGTELYKETSYDEAARYFQMLTPRDEAVADDWLFLGRSRLKLNKYPDAIEALQAYLGRVKDPVPRATGSLELAQAQIGKGDFSAAQKAVDEALALQPEGILNGEGRIGAGDIQMAQGNYEEAAKIYRSVSAVLDEEPVTPRALEKAVAAYKKAGNEAEAKKTLNTLQSRYPEYYQRNAKVP